MRAQWTIACIALRLTMARGVFKRSVANNYNQIVVDSIHRNDTSVHFEADRNTADTHSTAEHLLCATRLRGAGGDYCV